MRIEEIDNADISLIDKRYKKPHCKKHGAMNKISPTGIWRCMTQYHGSCSGSQGYLFVDRVCNAGCRVISKK